MSQCVELALALARNVYVKFNRLSPCTNLVSDDVQLAAHDRSPEAPGLSVPLHVNSHRHEHCVANVPWEVSSKKWKPVDKVLNCAHPLSLEQTSSICKAAIHAGVIPPDGGFVDVLPLDKRKNYVGVLKNGIQSER